MPQLSWHEALIIFSFFAAIAGLALAIADRNSATDVIEAADNMLITMGFAYWLVYCAAIGLQKLMLPEWELAVLSIKITGVIAYLLTASCILSLPLNRISIRQEME
jgi:hypothetical protein